MAKVCVDGIPVEFGCCFHEKLSRKRSPEEKDEPLFVSFQWNPLLSELHLSSCMKHEPKAILFEHAPYCPARVHNTCNPNLFVRIGVASVLESPKDHAILLTKRHAQLRSFPNIWVIPGGHVDPGETLFEAAQREVFEETHLKNFAPAAALLGIWESTFPHLAQLGPMTHHHAVCYVHSTLLANDEEILVQASEVQAIAWLTKDLVRSVLAGSEDDFVSVFQAEDSEGGDWHAEKSKLKKHAVLESARNIAENLSAGTRFALKLWLQSTSEQRGSHM